MTTSDTTWWKDEHGVDQCPCHAPILPDEPATVEVEDYASPRDLDMNEFPPFVELYCGQVGAYDREALRRRIEGTYYDGDELGRCYVSTDGDTMVEAFLGSRYEGTDGDDYMTYVWTIATAAEPTAPLAQLRIRIDGRS